MTDINEALKKIARSKRRLKDMAIIIPGAIATFAGVCIYEGNEKFYREYVMPAFHLFGAETAHKLAIKAAKYGLVPRQRKADPPSLKTSVFGREFSNPVGLAAGFDKDGEAVDGMFKVGFGFVEVGTVTPKPQEGNPKPRVFRLKEDKAVINRYGFNSQGHEAVYDRLKQREEGADVSDIVNVPKMEEQRNMLNINLWTETDSEVPSVGIHKGKGVLGVNLGKNKTSSDPEGDYTIGVKKFGELADYLVVNISSPNTPGLRNMQGKAQLEKLLDKVIAERDKLKKKKPLLVKIAPDLTEKDKQDIAQVVLKQKNYVDGIIVNNTTVSRPESLQSFHKNEVGGVSGQPLTDMSTKTIFDMYTLTKGSIPIVGVGGISSGQDAYDKIKAGACLVQLYTALVYEGTPLIGRIKRELDQLLTKDGYKSVSEAVGGNHRWS
uniref:Dihydroorotate dehydrogenase (quinone), mitochondrial n=1 Tax=Pinctada fucata TaxID=50426 RepID=A0AAU8BEW5_PINFU